MQFSCIATADNRIEVEKIPRKVGLRMNAGRYKIMVSNNWEDSTVITTAGTNIEVVEDFLPRDAL